ncbi:DNA helicase, putative [Medicago truncatula]|uniref:DNA 3'-5' helicase n=1 Tax=Medicago truncatula TaxID=3880 RepID=G7KIU2_MEDTR|nr:DNA helicase, putative [Medicago truncatula]
MAVLLISFTVGDFFKHGSSNWVLCLVNCVSSLFCLEVEPLDWKLWCGNIVLIFYEKFVNLGLDLMAVMSRNASVNRPNIYYEVRYKDRLEDRFTDVYDTLFSMGEVCAIIYCPTQSMCDNLTAYLSHRGISCAAYHAGMNSEDRTSVLHKWISSIPKVAVGTVDNKQPKVK